MPLFGKKKDKKDEKEKLRLETNESTSYPRNQPAPYPTQPPSYEVAIGAQQPAARLLAQASFDSGARFSSTNPPSIPPPPPGHAPNQAQVAMMTGQPVQMIKAKKGFMKEPTSNGGYTFL